MDARRLLVPLLFGSFAVAASRCGSDRLPTGVRLTVRMDPSAAGVAADHLMVGWLAAAGGRVRPARIPASGRLGVRDPLARLQIELLDDDKAPRRLVVTARDAAEVVVAWAAQELTVPAGSWTDVLVTLTAAPWNDADADGVPDAIDRCRGDDYVGCEPVDAGIVADGSPIPVGEDAADPSPEPADASEASSTPRDASVAIDAAGPGLPPPDARDAPPAVEAPAPEVLLTGVTFGTSPPYAAGREFDKAWDSNVGTFFDTAAQVNDNAVTGLDAGRTYVLTRLRFYPRSEHRERMAGGKFQVAEASIDGPWTDLVVVAAAPPAGWTEAPVATTRPVRYVRYVGPVDGHGNVAEIQVFGRASP